VSAQSLAQGSPEGESFILQYQRFVKALLASSHRDNIVIMLLIVMTLLSPDRAEPTGSGAGLVASAQEEYAGAMSQYVTVNYPGDPLMLARLLQRLVDIRDINERHTAMLMNVSVDQLEPIISEIFDLT